MRVVGGDEVRCFLSEKAYTGGYATVEIINFEKLIKDFNY